MIWAMHDLSSGYNTIYYFEVVARLLSPSDVRRGIFETIKDIEDTKQRLVQIQMI
jgi:hypothetical protein